MYPFITVECKCNHSPSLLVYYVTSFLLMFRYWDQRASHTCWCLLLWLENYYCIHLNNILMIFSLSMNHHLVKLSCNICTLILLLSIVFSILLQGTDHRHSFGVAHIIVIKPIIVACENNVMSYRYCIKNYRPVSILGVVNNTILSVCRYGIQYLQAYSL